MTAKPSYLIAKNLVKQIRTGRKVFKLLKFVGEYKEVTYQIGSFNFEKLKLAAKKVFFSGKQFIGKEEVNAKVVFADFLLTINKVSAMIYFMLDNLLWVITVGMLGPAIINIKRLKFWKKVFNLIKNWSQWGRAILLYRIHRKSLLSIEKSLDKHRNVVCGSTNLVATETMRNYINMH